MYKNRKMDKASLPPTAKMKAIAAFLCFSPNFEPQSALEHMHDTTVRNVIDLYFDFLV